MNKKMPVAVLAATGSVGQRFVELLENHPWFDLVAVTGSERRHGLKYGDTCHWYLSSPMPERARQLEMLPTRPEAVDVPLVFSALPSSEAEKVEADFAEAGIAVCTNAGAFRTHPDVPVLLPEVNADHADLIPVQRQKRGWSGLIATNPNCTSTGVTITLKALLDEFGLKKVFAVSMQALSGAGYPGVASMDIQDNVVPFISNEEPKFEWEPRKMLGTIEGDEVKLAEVAFSTHTNRVAVTDGHLVCLTVELENRAIPEEAARVLAAFQGIERGRNLPSTPNPVILIRTEPNRPQPRLDRMTGDGMTTVVGRIREDTILDLRLLVLSHNTIRGAAGGSIYNAELLVNEGLVK
jgi:aspartate-semialdehyde dehydrogenase